MPGSIVITIPSLSLWKNVSVIERHRIYLITDVLSASIEMGRFM